MKPSHQRFVDVGTIGDGEDPVLRVKEDFAVGVPQPIIFAPDPFSLGFTVLFSGFLDFSHLD